MAEQFDAMQTLAKILTEHGPLDEDELARWLSDVGVADPDAFIDEFFNEMDCPISQVVDERWVWLPTLLAGRVFTHRLDADEVVHDMLTVAPDLHPLTTLCEYEGYGQFVDGSPAQVAMSDYDDELLEDRNIPEELIGEAGVLLLTPGTLATLGAAPGDLVGVRLTEQGLVVEKVAVCADDAEVGARLAATVDDDEPVFFDAAVWTACVADPALFTEPVQPLAEIADECGLAYDGEWLAPDGFDFDGWRFDRRCAALAERHGLDPDDAIALYTLIQLFETVSRVVDAAAQSIADGDADEIADADEPPERALCAVGAAEPGTDEFNSEVERLVEFAEFVGQFGVMLADPLLAELLVAETIGAGRDGAPALAFFAEVLSPTVPRAAQVAIRWLRAVALERIGDIDACEQELLAAESLNPNWPLPLMDLARFAADRGDAERGLALLRRADAMPDHPLVQLLERHRTEPRRDIGRNAPCWCGSGVKYKKCHLGREQLSLDDRVGWLYMKASQHALLAGWGDELAEVAYERCRYADDLSDALESAMRDPLVMDAVLFEGGAFEEFLEVRGSRLPDDERLLAEQWALVERSVFEVEEVRRGQGITVRDLRTGDTHEVHERTASRQLTPGQLICARVVPAGDTMQIFGGIEPLSLHERDPLIELLDEEPDAVTLVAQLSRRFAPPGLVNTEGDPLAICEATVRIGEPGAVETVLDSTFDRVDGDGPPQWLEYVTIDGARRVRATLALDGDTLRVGTNSEERMDRVLDILARLDPEMEVLDDSRSPIRDVRDAAKLAEQLPTMGEGALDPDDLEVAAMLDQFIRDYETKWLNEPIPALKGYTPRQAADDPTRRGDLIRLLDSFPAEARSGTMDVGRLRSVLGLG